MIWRCDIQAQYLQYQEQVDSAVARVLHSGRYLLAEELKAFEREFATYLGIGGAKGVANGTDALVLALKAYGIGPGDEVITTPFTAIPTVSAIVDAGATPVFVDVCRATFLLDIEKVSRAVTPATKAIMPVHIFGNVVDVEALRRTLPTSIPIIEDACQAHGSSIRGKKAGTLGDAAAFSFYPTKNLGGYGDGGMVVSNDQALLDKVGLLRMYGMTDYNHIVFHGRNSRLDELQAAVLRAKLPHLDAMNERRAQIASYYTQHLDPAVFVPQVIASDVVTNHHVYVCRYRGNRSKLIEHCDRADVQTNIYYLLPLHLQEANRNLGIPRGALPVVEALCDEVIALPMYPELPDTTLAEIVGVLQRFRG